MVASCRCFCPGWTGLVHPAGPAGVGSGCPGQGAGQGGAQPGLQEPLPWLYYGKAWWVLAPVSLVSFGVALGLFGIPGTERGPGRTLLLALALLLVAIHLTGIRHDTPPLMVYPFAACFTALVIHSALARLVETGAGLVLALLVLTAVPGACVAGRFRWQLDFNPDVESHCLAHTGKLSAPGDGVPGRQSGGGDDVLQRNARPISPGSCR